MPDVTNENRADWAEQALDTFRGLTRTDDCDAIQDLMCNLLHLAERRGMDVDKLLAAARSSYEEEVAEDGPQVPGL